MAKHPELCFILLSLFVTFLSNYGSSFKSKPLVVPARTPEPLFRGSSMSSVVDLHGGDLDPLVDLLQQEDLVFVMYYAPWCAKSHALSAQFSTAAKFMEGQVRFVAVNCWYPEGPCRKQYKFLLFPVFFAYHKNNDGYRYMGIERAEFMVKFLEDLQYPLSLLRDSSEVQNFVTQHDTVVVGYFDFNSSPQPPGFQQFFYASMRVVEHDPYQPIKFGIVSDPALAALYHMKQLSDIVHLRINNSTLRFPWPNNITSSNIVKWVFAGRHQLPVRWVVPLGLKSLTLSREINKGPAIIMFHRVVPLSPASYSFSVFKELALRYHQCSGDHAGQATVFRWWSLSLRHTLGHVNALQTCQQHQAGTPTRTHTTHTHTRKCCISTATECGSCLPEARFNICEICQHHSGAQRGGLSVCSFQPGESWRWFDSGPFSSSSSSSSSQQQQHLPANSCLNSISSYDVSSHTSVCCKWCHKNISYSEFLTAPFYTPFREAQQASAGGQRRPTDRYVLDSLERLPRRLCERLAFQKSQGVFPSTVVTDVGRSKLPEEFTGHGCRANRSLTFLSVDAQSHWMFAQRLGLNVSQAGLAPVIVLFDKEKEEQHILHDKFSRESTAMFILNFTRGALRQDLRSLPPARHAGCGSGPSLCVTELTTQTLHSALDQPQDLVLLVYAGWCGFCTALSHVFLHLAHYFHTSANITFARINGDTNDLPWEFTMESYPSIIFFPAHREADSVAFPDTVAPSLPNLIRFVLQHTTFTTRLHLATDVCSAPCLRDNLDLAAHALRSLRQRLRRLTVRRNLMLRGASAGSGYLAAAEEILRKREEEVRGEVKDVKALLEWLERSQGGEEAVGGRGRGRRGGGLDPEEMRRRLLLLLQDKMGRKDSSSLSSSSSSLGGVEGEDGGR
ncbi:thioredoxin domain-containing protein 11-like [Babylonia areolata]|uniref:thioredoxin domain-containing protein 11-like n=1 Tax=Babylonia areolata TaxID=304850 RepID=UPI003FCF3190